MNGAVASVQLQTTNGNPRVGQTTHVGATPVDAHGLQVQGVACAFTSSNPGVAAVDAASGGVSAISAGVATITATCGGKAATIDITVRPNTVTLTIQKQGTGNGAVFASPAGTPTYDLGTSVRVTSTPNPGSTFVAWGGACAAVAFSSPCDLVLNNDTTVTATFDLANTYAGPYSGALGSLTGVCGCGYSRSVSGQLSLTLFKDSAGNVTGTGSAPTTVTTTVTYTPPATTCSGGSFTVTPTGPVSGTSSNLTATLTDGDPLRPYQLTFTGAWNATTVTGSATISRIFHSTGTCGPDQDFPQSATYGPLTLSKQ